MRKTDDPRSCDVGNWVQSKGNEEQAIAEAMRQIGLDRIAALGTRAVVHPVTGLAYPSAEPCAKCLGEDIGTRYQPTRMERNPIHHFGCPPAVCPDGEHLHRQCGTCGAEWIEATADSFGDRSH